MTNVHSCNFVIFCHKLKHHTQSTSDQLIETILSVGPTGVCWAVDKKETVSNIKEMILKIPTWKRGGFHVISSSKVWRRLGAKNTSIIGTKWQSVTGRCKDKVVKNSRSWIQLPGWRPSLLARRECGASRQRTRFTIFSNCFASHSICLGDVPRWHLWPARRCRRIRLEQGEVDIFKIYPGASWGWHL